MWCAAVSRGDGRDGIGQRMGRPLRSGRYVFAPEQHPATVGTSKKIGGCSRWAWSEDFANWKPAHRCQLSWSGFPSYVRPRGLFARCAHGVKSPNSMAEFAEEFPSENAETPYRKGALKRPPFRAGDIRRILRKQNRFRLY